MSKENEFLPEPRTFKANPVFLLVGLVVIGLPWIVVPIFKLELTAVFILIAVGCAFGGIAAVVLDMGRSVVLDAEGITLKSTFRTQRFKWTQLHSSQWVRVQRNQKALFVYSAKNIRAFYVSDRYANLPELVELIKEGIRQGKREKRGEGGKP
jgi:hypothetical protein